MGFRGAGGCLADSRLHAMRSIRAGRDSIIACVGFSRIFALLNRASDSRSSRGMFARSLRELRRDLRGQALILGHVFETTVFVRIDRRAGLPNF